MKHTSGDWYYESDGEGIPSQHRDKYICANGGGRVASLCTPDGASQHEVIANGRLIAAAPDLLEALTACLNDSPALDHLPAGPRARAAIAKATGAKAKPVETPLPEIPPEIVADMREWLACCSWPDIGADEILKLPAAQIIKAVQRHYDGGIGEFVLNFAESEENSPNLEHDSGPDGCGEGCAACAKIESLKRIGRAYRHAKIPKSFN